jgi:hypothetical protein
LVKEAGSGRAVVQKSGPTIFFLLRIKSSAVPKPIGRYTSTDDINKAKAELNQRTQKAIKALKSMKRVDIGDIDWVGDSNGPALREPFEVFTFIDLNYKAVFSYSPEEASIAEYPRQQLTLDQVMPDIIKALEGAGFSVTVTR